MKIIFKLRKLEIYLLFFKIISRKYIDCYIYRYKVVYVCVIVCIFIIYYENMWGLLISRIKYNHSHNTYITSNTLICENVHNTNNYVQQYLLLIIVCSNSFVCYWKKITDAHQ